MKLNTAFKLSALTAALVSTSVFAATTDTSVVNDSWTDPSKAPVGAIDTSKYQYVDLGSINKESTIDNQNKQRPVEVAEHKVGDKNYYLVNKSQILTLENGKLVAADIQKTQLTEDNFVRGGTADNYVENDVDKTSIIKRIDSSFVQYGETSSTLKGAATGTLAVTNSLGNQVTPYAITNDNTGQIQDKGKDDVKLGIIGTTKVDGKDKNTYGVVAEKTDGTGKVTASTTLTAEGIKTTGTVDAADFSINGKSITSGINDAVAKATQTIDAKIAQFDNIAGNLNKRLDDIEETAYRGTAIALAASQQIPNIKPGQFALFGGVGHYEGESAVAFGGVYALSEKVSISGALGTAGSEVGGRVGASFIFGGN